MKRILGWMCALGLGAGAALGQSPVTVAIDTQNPGAAIPANFTGLSFGMKALLPNQAGAHFFSATNMALVTLFQNLGLHHLRVGGTTVESPPDTPIPDATDIDNLFAFARAAGVDKIIYSLRLLESDPAQPYAATNAAIAKYIWSRYQSNLDCFALGNEPDRAQIYKQDLTISNFPTYLDKWQKFASAIIKAVPEAKFAGPDAGSGNISWTTRFAKAEKESGLIKIVTEHYYAGGKGKGLEASDAIEAMLSPGLDKASQKLYEKMAVPVLSTGLPYRFTEANDHYSGGVADASDTFAGALWALDFLHWWAAHSASGVDFHNTEWVVSDIITLGSDERATINPKAYGLRAFDLGSHGAAEPLTMTNTDEVNLTAYAVRGESNLFVTIINKEHGPGARAADVTIKAEAIAGKPEAIFLTAPNGDVTAKTGVSLGGSAIASDFPWPEKWTRLTSGHHGQCVIQVPAASAAIVKIATE